MSDTEWVILAVGATIVITQLVSAVENEKRLNRIIGLLEMIHDNTYPASKRYGVDD